MMNEPSTKKIAQKVRLALVAQRFEHLWAACLWPCVVLGFMLGLGISGLLASLPVAWRVAVGLLGLVVFSISLKSLVWQFRKGDGSSRSQAIARIEQASGLSHQPLAQLEDHLTLPRSGAEEMESLWQAHKARQLAALTDLQVGWPQSAWARLDQMAWRSLSFLFLFVCVIYAQGNSLPNLQQIFSRGAPVQEAPLRLDAWLKPPAYTGKPAHMLQSQASLTALPEGAVITTPKGSLLTVMVTGAVEPLLEITLPDKSQKIIAFNPQAGTETALADVRLDEALHVKMTEQGQPQAAWHFTLQPDKAPSIEILGPPTANAAGVMRLKWQVADDYGVSKIDSSLVLADEQADGTGFDGNGIFLFEAPPLAIALARAGILQQQGTTTADLAAHPWAGLNVTLTLTATDVTGQSTSSLPVSFQLPERIFTLPLAQALIEQRKSLIMDPATVPQVANLLTALLTYPRGLFTRSGNIVGLATLAAQLRNHSDPNLQIVIDDLWLLALQIETGTSGSVREELARAQKALQEGLARGETPERLKELRQKMQSAMQKYLNELAQQAPPENGQDTAQNSQSLSKDELQKMLDMIEKLNQEGKTAEAQKLLEKLNEILETLRPSNQQAAGGEGQKGGQSDSSQEIIKDLGEILKKQQELMDQSERQKTAKQQQENGQGQPEQGQAEQDQAGQKGQALGQKNQGNEDSETAANQQRDLQNKLEELQGKLENFGHKPPQQLGEAGKNMGEARKELEQKNPEAAQQQQAEALKNLRAGAQDLARRMREQEQGQQDNTGGADPLGRKGEQANGNESEGEWDNIEPDRQMQASKILEELRQRLNLPHLPLIDKLYLEQLLNDLK